MSETETPNEFAYMDNEVGDCVCPAVAAGFDPDEDVEVREAAGEYDMTAKQYSASFQRNTLREEEAREAWLEAIEALEHHELASASVAREIADELGWLDEEGE